MKLRKLRALSRRLPLNHISRGIIQNDLNKSNAGYKGEQSLDYHLTFLPENEYLILHDLRLKDPKDRYFQIDTLILSSKFILIFEVKNLLGDIYFDQPFSQLIRTFNGERDAFDNPIAQVERQQYQLASWLKKFTNLEIPIIPLIIITNSSSIIETNPGQEKISDKVIRPSNIKAMLEQLEIIHTQHKCTKKEVRKLGNQLLNSHIPLNPDLLAKYKVRKIDVLRGVHCPECFNLPIYRNWGKWHCSICNAFYKNAHFDAIEDYSLLIGNTITNRELRDFLNVTSAQVVYHLVRDLRFTSTGTFRNRSYILPIPK